MEKRRLISLRSVLLQYLVRTALACLLVAVGWLLVLLLWIQNSGLFLPANQAAQACQKAAQDILPGMTAATFDETQLDSLCRYALFAAPDSSEVLATNMDAGHLQRAMENRQGKTRWHFGYTQYYMTSKLQDGTVCLLQFDYAVPYADPALRGVLPDMQTVHCILGILLLVGAVVWSTHRTGRFLTRETEKLTAAAQAVARKDLDSAVFSGAKVREYESALQALQTMGDELTRSHQKQWDMEQRQREQIIQLSHKLKTPLTIIEGNAELKKSVRMMLDSRRMTHSLLLVGEEGLGTGFAARCVAADYLYPNGGAPAEALLRGECCRAVAKAGKRDSGQVETGIVREAISVSGMGSGGRYLVGQVTAMRSEIFNTSLSAEGRAVLLYHVERMNEESANALLKVMEEPPEGVLFLLTADSLAGVLPTIRSRCVSFAVAPVSPEQCARYCVAQGVDKKTAALYSELFDGHIGTVLAAARDEARTAQVEKALQLAKAAADRDSYAAACLLAAYEKDKAGAAALLTDFRAVAAAGLRQSPHAPVQGIAAQRALRLAEAAIQRLGAQVNPKIVLSVFAAKLA